MSRTLIFLIILLSPLLITAKAQDVPTDSLRSDVSVTVPDDSVANHAPVTPSGPKSTPVDIDDAKPVTVLHYYDKHGEPLDEPVMFLATLDTVTKVRSKPIYPAFNGVNVGLNFGDAIMMAFGRRYASFDVWANVSVWNWLFPTVELGFGYANDSPNKTNYKYRVDPSFYAKIGLYYNFLYKSNPDYKVFVGFRAGFSSFKYALRDVTISSDYWNETEHLDIDGLKATCWYGEALAGVQVRIYKGFSLGWSARYHFKFNNPADRGNKPWFIPGYGASFPLSLNVSAIWTIPGKRQPKTEIDKADGEDVGAK